jgi:hypothetical protein
LSGKLSRTKGLNFERAIAVELRCVFPAARRLLENHSEDAQGVDILHTGRFKFQCKRGRRYASFTAIEEIQCDPALGDVPVLVTRADDKPALAALPWADFLDLLKLAKIDG